MSASALELLPFADTRARATMLHSPDSKGELMASVIPQMFPTERLVRIRSHDVSCLSHSMQK
jgi:hypothetical protein